METTIRCDAEELWQLTQQPRQHQRWDLRFTEIDYLARPDPAEPQRFRYAVRVLPGVVIAGTGVTAGERTRADGARTSALRFDSGHPLSLIRSGAGYWRYVPTPDGVRFITGYDYEPGWGRLGRLADRLFRPLMGWGTAWSFDRLRLWLEHGTPPERSLRHGLMDAGLRIFLCVGVWWLLPPYLAAAIVAAALLIPPLPSSPAARRCQRRPPDRQSASVPAIASTLEP